MILFHVLLANIAAATSFCCNDGPKSMVVVSSLVVGLVFELTLKRHLHIAENLGLVDSLLENFA